jgi:hypothetical protein
MGSTKLEEEGEYFTPSPQGREKVGVSWGSDVSTDLHAVARHCTNRIPDLREDDQGGKPEER